MALETIFPFLKIRRLPEKKEDEKEAAVCEDVTPYKTRLSVYRKIIEKYTSVINAGEEKTVPQLKALVDKGDEVVAKVKEKIAESLPGADVIVLAETAYKFVQSLRPVHANLSVTYWLSPKDIMELGAADAFDRAIFLCSLLQALGLGAKVRVVSLEGGLSHPVVIFSFGRDDYILDAFQNLPLEAFKGSLPEVLPQFTFDGRRFVKNVFEFNNEEFNQFD
ncbi:MAG: hypothetical protein NTY90_01330 [Candidatus Micrarchaeota archaeon]|nr:hypothetical protein [Candidatus Micrarchaeota archaeon]